MGSLETPPVRHSDIEIRNCRNPVRLQVEQPDRYTLYAEYGFMVEPGAGYYKEVCFKEVIELGFKCILNASWGLP